MTRRLTSIVILVAALAGALAAAPAVLAGDPCFHSDDRPPVSTGATVAIAIGDCVFSPTVTYVASGTTVTWTNSSEQAHEVVGAHLTWGAHDKLLQQGDSIGWTFDEAGIYPYSCMLHPGMTGAVVVGDAGEPAAAAAQEETASAGTTESSGGVGPAAIGVGGAIALGLLGVALVLRRRAAAQA